MIKKWHLFAFVIIFFCLSFYIINLKFDKFYRVNGINNDNRVLIERYLTQDEQEYLIDNQINIDLFIDYIDYPDFILKNYQYYNLLEKTERYSKKQDILTTGNVLSSRLSYLFNDKAYTYCETLIENYLESGFLNNSNFNFDYLEYYKLIVGLYDIGDYSYVEHVALYVNRLNELNINNPLEAFNQLTSCYDQKSLYHLMTKSINDDQTLVFNPSDLSSIVDYKHYIGIYEPDELILVQDVTRIKYSMYLRGDAYIALLEMFNELDKELNGFLLKKAYVAPDLMDHQSIGYDEFQLGLSIEVTKQNTPYDKFDETEIAAWLENNAYKYGYILRYPKNKASITGYEYDSHIYRYVGKELASDLYNKQITLEEYELIKE